jgi:hypothetical protein
VKAGPVHEVLASRGGEGVRVRLRDLEAGRKALATSGVEATVDGDMLRVPIPPAEAEKVTKFLAEHGLFLSELRPDEVDLETVFLELTREPEPEPPA